MDTDETMAVLKAKLDAIKQNKARRAWLASEEGVRFRWYCSRAFRHTPTPIGKQTWCHLCSRTVGPPNDGTPAAVQRNKRRRIGSRSRLKCDTCGVCLCFPSKANGMRDCFKKWHATEPGTG